MIADAADPAGGEKKTSHERGILWLPVVRWNRSSPAPGAAYCGETGTGVKWAQTWRKRNTTVPAPEYMFWGWNSKQKWFSRLLFWCRRLRWKNGQNPSCPAIAEEEEKWLWTVVLEVCPLLHLREWSLEKEWGNCITLPSAVKYHLSQLGKCNANLNLKCYTDQSMILKCISWEYSINIEKWAEKWKKKYYMYIDVFCICSLRIAIPKPTLGERAKT